MSDEKASPRERRIGQNVERLRREVDKTQKEVADFMRAAGFKWSQATVWSVERGERPLRLSEAYELAKLLRVHVAGLLLTKESAVMADQLLDTYRTYREARWELESSLREVREAIKRASSTVHEITKPQLMSLKNELPDGDLPRVLDAHSQLAMYAEGGLDYAIAFSLERLDREEESGDGVD